ncbi:uncharacterized protein BO95DRAFT_459838 [Aspergillus brunneoviolaceus CBS 621.78]|uniref:Uncharacterized protein n=1 Tax=Aspergillus brunneoviolaceus CBS 621.78 TaxID=1450534 RepID=A0ACD1GLD6_9EURO|nr:hypothetical protein BO95DRAFT_459838 [Aspergillus brunneoviolaceus CBS 621.78]RAH49891.1 hypothetical protein BO95DRAFT_459838 [Aspergillus brunneoviolaceus CBS 621.78]
MKTKDTKRFATSSEDDRRCSVYKKPGRTPQKTHRQHKQTGQTTRGTRLQSLPNSSGQGRDRAPASQTIRDYVYPNSLCHCSHWHLSQVSNDQDVVMRDVSGQATQGMRLQSLPNSSGQGRDRAPASQKPRHSDSRRCRSQRRPSQVSNDQDVVMRDVRCEVRNTTPASKQPPRPANPRSILKVSNGQDVVMKDVFLPKKKVHFAGAEVHLFHCFEPEIIYDSDVEMAEAEDEDVEMEDADVEMVDAPELPWWVCDVSMESILKVSNDQDVVMKDVFLSPKRAHFEDAESQPLHDIQPMIMYDQDIELFNIQENVDVDMEDVSRARRRIHLADSRYHFSTGSSPRSGQRLCISKPSSSYFQPHRPNWHQVNVGRDSLAC